MPDDMDYKVQIKAPGYKGQELDAKTKVDVYLGEIVLDRVK